MGRRARKQFLLPFTRPDPAHREVAGPAREPLGALLAAHGHELQAQAKLGRQGVRQVGLETHGLAPAVAVGPRHLVRGHAEAQAAPLQDLLEPLAGDRCDLSGPGRGRGLDRGEGTPGPGEAEPVEGVGGPLRAGQHLVEQQSAAEQECANDDDAADAEHGQPGPVHAQPAGHEVGAEQGQRERVHGGRRAAGAAVEDARDKEELEEVRGNPREVEQERYGGVEAPEQAQQARAGQRGIAGGGHRRADEPACEEDEAQAQQLRAVREGEGRRHQDVHGLVRVVLPEAGLGEQRLAPLGQQRQHDEQVGRHECRQQRVDREGHDAPVGQAGQRRDEAGQEPQREDEREARVDEQERLQPLELLEAQRPRRVAGDREQAEWRQLHEQGPGPPERVVDEVEHREDALLAGQAEHRETQQHREHHHGRHDVVRERAERVRRDVEVEPVDPRLAGELAARVEGTALVGRQGERAEEDDRQAERPEEQERQPALGREPPRLGGRAARDPRDQRTHHVGQHGDLEQLHEAPGRQVQEGRLLSEEEADREAGREAEEDLLREAHEARV